ncbi:alpha/beta hydrolase [Undibacterium seohonense]|uniref:Alpha/beta hydrolase n=1 Tax=Undibacterium seohonense TaxID=1344950 RepID=A0ABR6X6A7_9BURK|nr:alpha/beta hydrolase [Undibacterium seohonense]MBC3807886.1 alpha/beta hydrolase [Undibacterium seohonense]
MKKIFVNIGLGILGLFLVLLIVGVIYENLGRRNAAQNFPPPGKLVDIGGRHIQLDCRGSGSPTVVFQSGLDMAGSLSWSAVHDEIAKTTRACAYSRAGIMWSDPNEAPQLAKSIAEDLHAALKNANEKGPLVLVGHSLGGPYNMIYTKYFGADVAGLVFVDTSHPDQISRGKALEALESNSAPSNRNSEWNWSAFLYKSAAALNWTGIVRLDAAMEEKEENRPESDDQAVKAYSSTTISSVLKEGDAFEQTLNEAGTFRHLGDRPIVVLTMVRPVPKQESKFEKALRENWSRMQADQAKWSSQSQHQLVQNTSHYIQFDQPAVVIDAVRSVISKVREK